VRQVPGDKCGMVRMAFPVSLMCMCGRYKELVNVSKKQTFLCTKSVSVGEAVRGRTGLGMRLLLGFRGVNASVKCEPIAK
jgi:hypothetical protein